MIETSTDTILPSPSDVAVATACSKLPLDGSPPLIVTLNVVLGAYPNPPDNTLIEEIPPFALKAMPPSDAGWVPFLYVCVNGFVIVVTVPPINCLLCDDN